MPKKRINKLFDRLILAEKSVTKLSLSFCLGNFIAWLPIIPIQTPLIMFLCWIFKLNVFVGVTSLYIINNPLTLVPIYIADYLFGSWLFRSLLKIDIAKYNPSWVDSFNNFLSRYIDLTKYLGDKLFCFWCLIGGGIALGIITSLILYPIMKIIFAKLNENNNSK